MPNKQVLSSFLLVEKGKHTLASTKHNIFVQILQALKHQINVAIASNEKALGDRYLMPYFI
jgi:hypothetical protein